MRRLLLLVLACALLLPALGRRSYYDVDSYALQAPAVAERNLDELAAYLKKGAQSSEDRTRIVYRWITDRIAYDTQAFFSGTFPDQSAEAVLARRTAVCAGYSNLFEALAKRVGLDVAVVGGQIRHDPQDPDDQERGHAWNAVKLQGRWYLLDSTWGSGVVDYKTRRFSRRFNPYYFLVPPEQLIFSHIPDDKSWQLLPQPKTTREIESLPRVTSYYFRYDIRPKEKRGDLVATGQGWKLRFRAAPGVRLSANLYAPGEVVQENATLVQSEGDEWVVDTVFPQRGEYKLLIWGSDDPRSDTLSYVMDYRVEARRPSLERFPTFSGAFLSHRARVESPRTQALSSGKKLSFSLFVPDADDVQVVCGKQWQPLQRQGQWFRGQLQVPPGQVDVSARFPGRDNYQMLLRYRAD